MYSLKESEYRRRIETIIDDVSLTDTRRKNGVLALVFGIAHALGTNAANKMIVEMQLEALGVNPIHEFGPDDPNVAIAIAA